MDVLYRWNKKLMYFIQLLKTLSHAITFFLLMAKLSLPFHLTSMNFIFLVHFPLDFLSVPQTIEKDLGRLLLVRRHVSCEGAGAIKDSNQGASSPLSWLPEG
jgi:hypothetical protein